MDQLGSQLDTSVPHPARRYNYWLGGKDNFAADRESGDAIAQVFPTIRTMALENAAAHRTMLEDGRADVWPTTHAEMAAVFGGLTLVEPGIVPAGEWRPGPDDVLPDRAAVGLYAGVGRKS